ncbi:MAG: oligopeptide:H+ symporter [Haliscomenobacter sp.]|uniref:peptide MFS transporter n=1 Tax=Haliscomenobacter sp. TaxID=2717303 RepID=UPI0029B15C90|nr:oligopeptide:H+ symporter [Haliscomenobacter sp.]MDX2067291.1 oligopeptide:H+ symporter [Haliscomenobacter sp.]
MGTRKGRPNDHQIMLDIAQLLLISGWVFVLIWIPIVIYANRKIHPKAIVIIFLTEMWERFSYYGMRALLTLYMAKVLYANLGEQQANTKALGVYGAYTAMAYLFPVVGGMIADRFFGFRRSVIIGAAMMAIGHITLGMQGLPGFESSQTIFFLSLAIIIVGNGYFKPNMSSFLGTFYELDDPRKDSAYSIFYMGVNTGSLLAMLTCGYVGQRVGWHYGFGLAGIGMTLGLILFAWLGPRYFEDKGLPTDPQAGRKPLLVGLSVNSTILLGTILLIPLVMFLLNPNAILNRVLLIVSASILGYLIWTALRLPDKKEGQRLLVVVFLFFFHMIFWMLFEQAGGSIALFTDKNVNRMVAGTEIPAAQFGALNGFFVILLAPFFSWLWIWLGKKKLEPSTPLKFVLSLLQIAIGFGLIVWGARSFANDGLVPLIFLVLMYFFHTSGELSISPVGLSMISKLSPPQMVGFVMGAWYLSISLGNSLASEIGKLTAVGHSDGADLSRTESLMMYTDTYLLWGIYVVVGITGVLALLIPLLRKWMHGVH